MKYSILPIGLSCTTHSVLRLSVQAFGCQGLLISVLVFIFEGECYLFTLCFVNLSFLCDAVSCTFRPLIELLYDFNGPTDYICQFYIYIFFLTLAFTLVK
jgi:hypothetical protein